MSEHRWFGSMALAAAVLVLGVFATLGVTVVISGKERRSAQQVIQRQSDLAAATVAAEVRRYLDTIDNVAAALGSHDALSPDEFERATSRVPGEAGRRHRARVRRAGRPRRRRRGAGRVAGRGRR